MNVHHWRVFEADRWEATMPKYYFTIRWVDHVDDDKFKASPCPTMRLRSTTPAEWRVNCKQPGAIAIPAS